tara:strand:+ start:881 stop:1459 length:579 start_codon:yes stop_codon:yes gene_type:complete
MAALDFGMAKARGLVAPGKQLQEELRKLSGDMFKSEEWWNQQLDRQIKEGVTEKKTRTETTYPQGFNQYGSPNVFQPFQSAPRNQYGLGTGRQPLDASYFAPVTKTINYTEQRGLTNAELKDISKSSKQASTRAKSIAAAEKKSKGKTTKGVSGGLIATAIQDRRRLGVTGLGLGNEMLGQIGLGVNKGKLG